MNKKELDDIADDYVGICDSDLHEGITHKILMEAHQRKKIFKLAWKESEKHTIEKVLEIFKENMDKDGYIQITPDDLMNKIRKEFGVEE